MPEYSLNELLKPRPTYPLPPYPKSNPAAINQPGDIEGIENRPVYRDKIEQTIFGTPQVFPLSVKLQSEQDYWLFPIEPLISIEGKNILIKRNVAKKKVGFGSIKEYWTQDDYGITIEGLIKDDGSEYDYPREDVVTLMRYATAKEPLDVKCPILELLGITRIVIEDYTLPFTKGQENQNYSIKAVSDTDWSLLLKKKTSVSAT